MTARLAAVTAAMDAMYPPAVAQEWDAVGLVCGDPDAPVTRVLLAVDPVAVVAQEALAGGFDLLVTHHPLFLRGTSTVAATQPKGRMVHELITGGSGLFVAHTNADTARPGVSDALAALFDLRDTEPVVPVPDEPLDLLVVFVPVGSATVLRDALTAAGAGELGDYDRCTWTTNGSGTFRPLEGAHPALGELGRLEQVQEARIEVVLARSRRDCVLAALHRTHPYEVPAYHLLEPAAGPGRRGYGRVGDLPNALTVGELTALAAEVLPATATGVRASGDPDAVVTRLAVGGGSGDDALGAAAAGGAQAFLTADLRHHRASEAPEGLALLDAAHWATEWPWLPDAAARLARLVDVETAVSNRCTDPWTLSRPTTCSRSPRA